MKRKILIIFTFFSLLFCSVCGYVPVVYSLCETDDIAISYYPDLYEMTTDYEELTERFYLSEISEYRKYYTASEKVINGESPEINNIGSFEKYFCFLYQLSISNDLINIYEEEGDINITSVEETKESRQDAIKLIIETIGIEEVSNPYLAVISAAVRVRSCLTYDIDYLQSTMQEALSDGKGVCTHYAQIMKVILNAEGIPCRVVYGMKGEKYHDWNEVYIDGSWYIVDACIETTGFVYIPIGYEEIQI